MPVDKTTKEPREKVSKASVDYSRGMATSHCSICRNWIGPKTKPWAELVAPGAKRSSAYCSKVRGLVDPSYWCQLYEKQ
jgi:hypothetical protein